jgi:tRNA(fMet)-specific endonuclease VapC
MGILLDASILIESERRSSLEARIQGREDEEFYVSVVTASDLLHSVQRARNPSVRARRSAFVEAVLATFPLLDIDVATARVHARLFAELLGTEKLIDAHDLWLAASCIANGLTMVTFNGREFMRVPELMLEDWSKDPKDPVDAMVAV